MTRVWLALAVLFATGGALLAEPAAPALTGKEIAVIVRAALAENGQEGAPVLAEQRRYFPCEVPLAVAPRRAGRWDAVDVACAGKIPWSIVVRTSVEVPAVFDLGGRETEGEAKAVVVFRHSIRRDEVITADKLEIVTLERAPGPGTFSEIAPLIGRRMAQTLGAGVPLRERHLQRDWPVREGDPVVIETDTGAMVISMAGVALENGQIGDFIKVRNSRSQKTVQGRVQDGKKIIVTPNMN